MVILLANIETHYAELLSDQLWDIVNSQDLQLIIFYKQTIANNRLS